MMHGSFVWFVRKEFLQILRDRRTLLILGVMPIVLILIFGYAITTEVKNTRVAFVDLSKDDVTRMLIDEISANPNFKSVAASAANADAAERMFERGEAHLVVVFGADFADNLKHGGEPAIQILADGSEPNQAVLRVNYVEQVLHNGLSRVSGGAPLSQPYTLAIDNRMLFNPQLKSEYNFVPGIIGLIIILICAMMSSIAIVREKELGTMEILLASPMRPGQIIIAKLLPYFCISIFNLITILLISRYLIGLPTAGSTVAFMAVSVIYILVSLSLGLLISTFAGSQLMAMLLSLLLIVPSVYFSDMVFPIESMPSPFCNVPNIIPTRWYIQAARRLMVQGVGAVDVIKEIIILTVMAALLMVVSWKSFKTRL